MVKAKGSRLVCSQKGGPETIDGRLPWPKGLVHDNVHLPQPRLGSPDGPTVADVIPGLFVFEDEEGGFVGGKCLDGTEELDLAGGFGVVVFVQDVKGGGGRVDDDESWVQLLDEDAKGRLPRVEGEVFHGQALLEGTRVRGANSPPCPLPVPLGVRAPVLLVDIEDLGGVSRVDSKKGLRGGHAEGKVVAEGGLAGTGFPCEEGERATGKDALNDPMGITGGSGQEGREI